MATLKTGCWISQQSDFQVYRELGDDTIAYQFLAEQLIPETRYYLKAWAENERGVTYSSVSYIDTTADIPLVDSLTASNITSTTATITASASGSYYQIATYVFELEAQDGSKLSQTSANATVTFDNLVANTTYTMYCRCTNTNDNTSVQYNGGTFTTNAQAASITINTWTGATGDPTSSVINYDIVSSSSLISVTLEVDTDPTFSNPTQSTLPATSGSGQSATVAVASTSDTYYARLVAVNAGGSTTSSIIQLEALASVSITSITDITASSAVVTISVV